MWSSFGNGVDRNPRYLFDSTERAEKVRRARILAIRAAREKAEYLAAELGEKLARPLKIEEVYEESLLAYSMASTNSYELEGLVTSPRRGASISPQQLTVSAEVDVVFELGR